MNLQIALWGPCGNRGSLTWAENEIKKTYCLPHLISARGPHLTYPRFTKELYLRFERPTSEISFAFGSPTPLGYADPEG
jgi:hypothetical protein